MHDWIIEDTPSVCTDCHRKVKKWCSKCEACGVCGVNTKCVPINNVFILFF